MEFAALLVALAVGWYWLDTLKAREIALVAGENACRAEGWQFLDWTVAQAGVRLRRDDEGRVRLHRVYRFEYSLSGNDRHEGSVTLLGREIVALRLETPSPPPDNVIPLR